MHSASIDSTHQARIKTRRWGLALLLAMCSGVGYLYVGRPWRLVAMMVLIAVLIATLFFGPAQWLSLPQVYIALTVLTGSLYLFVVFDTVRLAIGQPEYQLRWYNRWWVYLFAFILLSSPSALLESPGGLDKRAVRLFSIPSNSGQPTLRPGDYITADTTAYRHAFPLRGDLIIFRIPSQNNIHYIDRVIALPGETVQIRNGTVFIDSEPVERIATGSYTIDAREAAVHRETLDNGRTFDTLDWISTSAGDNTASWTVPDQHYFVLGDNRDNSNDSRFANVGFVPENTIDGKAVGIVFARQWNRIGQRLDR